MPNHKKIKSTRTLTSRAMKAGSEDACEVRARAAVGMVEIYKHSLFKKFPVQTSAFIRNILHLPPPHLRICFLSAGIIPPNKIFVACQETDY